MFGKGRKLKLETGRRKEKRYNIEQKQERTRMNEIEFERNYGKEIRNASSMAKKTQPSTSLHAY